MKFSSTVLLLLCLASPASAGLFNRNKNGNGDGRRRLTEATTPQVEDWDMDASTGTVRKIPDPKEEEAKTCDGQMAKSLVKGNDDRLQAQSERDAALTGLKEVETSNTRLEQELKETKTIMLAKLERLEEQGQQTKEDAAKTVETLTKQGQEQVAKVEANAQETIFKLQEEKKDFEALKASEIEGLQELLDQQEQKLITESDAKLQLYKTEMEAKIEELTQNLQSQEEKEKKSVQEAVAKVEQEKTAAVKALQQEKEVIAKENAKIKKSLAEQVASFKSQKKELESKFKELNNESAKAIKVRTFETYLFRMVPQPPILSTVFISNPFSFLAYQDLEHWENLHATRSYCNVTHLTEDVSNAAMVYKEMAAGKLREFKETASVSARNLQVETVRLTNDNMEKSKTLAQEAMANARPRYEKSVKPHLDKAVDAVKPLVDQATAAAKPYVDKVTVAAKPYVDKVTVATKPYVEKAALMADETVFPLLAQAKEEVLAAMKIANNKTQEKFDKVVANYAQACPKASALVKDLAKEKNFQLPASVLQSMNTACQQPQESVIMALYALATIFVLLFRKALLRLVKWLILLPFRILLFFNPLRFCFTSKKKTIPSPKKAKVVKVAPPSGATPVRIKKKQRNGASTTRVSQ
jgi:hypothetical protein